MRLIDADALLERIENPYQYREVAVWVNAMPTIEERKKGKWLKPSREGIVSFDEKAYAECSVCGKKSFLGRQMNFCPNCGADMRGEEDE